MTLVQPGVFFSGDAGLKFLLVQQMGHSAEFKKILSEHPQWVQHIWDQHYYPFFPSFVYDINGEHWTTFPPLFQFLNAYLFKWFGYPGLYILPSLSVILTWLLLILGLRKLAVPETSIAFGLFILICCSPLTFYAAVYWEHSLAVLLVFPAAQWFYGERSSVKQAIMAGLLAGMALWFREESFVFTSFLLLFVFIGWFRQHNATAWPFIIATLLPVLTYFIFNYLVYGYFMGVHGLQIVQDRSLTQQLWKGTKLVVKNNLWQVLSFPVILFLLIPLFVHFRWRIFAANKTFQLIVALIGFSVCANYILPSDGDKQWGARFMLLVIPVTVFLLVLAYHQPDVKQLLLRNKWISLVFGMTLLYSCYHNTFQMPRTLGNDYKTRILPALQYIQADTTRNIIIDNQYIAQELTAEFNRKNFFLSDTARPMEPLLKLLKEAGQKDCILISVEKEKTSFPAFLTQSKDIQWQELGSYRVGKYHLE